MKCDEKSSDYCCNPLGVHDSPIKTDYRIPEIFATKYADYNLVTGQKICNDCIMKISSNISIFLHYYCLITHYLLDHIFFHQTELGTYIRVSRFWVDLLDFFAP